MPKIRFEFIGPANKAKPRLESVQVMRALAALSVCTKHVLHEVSFLNPSPLIPNLEALPWTLGVDLFFIISGFIMMTTSAKTFGKPGASVAFLKRRLIRIVPSYWFFTTLMVAATLAFPTQLNIAVFTLPHALMSYFFIPHFNPGRDGLLQPILGLGWTLVYEMFFYIVFALCLSLKEKNGLAALFALFACLFITARMDIWPEALDAFWGNSILFDFLLGVAVYKIIERGWITGRTCWAIMVLAVGVMAGAGFAGVFGAEPIFSGGLPALILFMLLWRLPADKIHRNFYGLILLGDASYALYLSHPFTLVIMKMAMKFLHVADLGIPALTVIYCTTAAAAAIGAAILFYVLLERPVTVRLQTFFHARRDRNA